MTKNTKRIAIITILIMVSIFTILFVSKIFINKKLPEINKTKNNKTIAIMISEDGSKYTEYEGEIWPGIGYIYSKSECVDNNGNTVEEAVTFDNKTRKASIKSKKTIYCTLYFDKDKTIVVDKSGNNFNGHLLNGAVIKQDDEGQKGLYLDGVDAYVDVDDLPDTIDWISGFTIEFEARWLALNYWSRIIDFGNGPDSDNILIGNVENTNNLMLSLRYDNLPAVNEKIFLNIINVGERNKYKIIYQKNEINYVEILYKDNELIESVTYETTDIIRNVLRTENYIGKSEWYLIADDENFYGYIYYLKITDSNDKPILWYDFTN